MQYGSSVVRVDYGAFELKRSYQRNFLIAIAVGVSLHLAALGILRVLIAWEDTAPSARPFTVITVNDPTDIFQPPSIRNSPPVVNIDLPESKLLKFGIPEPVSDPGEIESAVLATRTQLEELVRPPIGTGGSGEGINVVISLEDTTLIPSPTAFVMVQEQPSAVFIPQPEYPELARRAGIEGSVWIRALIDEDGMVRDAIVDKGSNANVGFEEAALKAAVGGRWTPGMQNNQPVLCWVSYKVEFVLH